MKQTKEINWLWVLLVLLMGATIALSYTDTLAYDVGYKELRVEYTSMFFHGWGVYAIGALVFLTRKTWLHIVECVLSLGSVWVNLTIKELYERLSDVVVNVLPQQGGSWNGDNFRLTALGTTTCVLSVAVTALMVLMTVACAKENRERKRLAAEENREQG